MEGDGRDNLGSSLYGEIEEEIDKRLNGLFDQGAIVTGTGQTAVWQANEITGPPQQQDVPNSMAEVSCQVSALQYQLAQKTNENYTLKIENDELKRKIAELQKQLQVSDLPVPVAAGSARDHPYQCGLDESQSNGMNQQQLSLGKTEQGCYIHMRINPTNFSEASSSDSGASQRIEMLKQQLVRLQNAFQTRIGMYRSTIFSLTGWYPTIREITVEGEPVREITLRSPMRDVEVLVRRTADRTFHFISPQLENLPESAYKALMEKQNLPLCLAMLMESLF